ncbi:MAG TPA: hypothetical protein VM345_17870 [Acidimicrobiales bacterium]|nr:hypothetical protein [Acidimicrobiales bacterium]
MRSDVVVAPAFLWQPPSSSTAGPEAAQLAESAGLVLDGEQRLVLDVLLAEDVHGRWAAFEGCVICARQNLKTVALLALVLFDLFATDARLIVWTAHLFDTAQEAFRDLVALVDGAPHLRRRVKHVHRARGDEGIELVDGRRLNFLARSRTGGRGLSGDRVVLDEAFALTAAEMGSLLPTMSARPNAQVVYASSAGLLSSNVLRGVRDRGRPGGDPTLAYVEWADPTPGGCAAKECAHLVDAPGCALDDVDRWRRANPALGRRIPVERVRAERRALSASPMEFARERLGWWEDPPTGDGGAFDLTAWLLLADPDARRGADRPAFGVDVSIDRLVHIAAAWRRPDGRVQVQLTATDGGRKVDSGLSPFDAPKRLEQLVAAWKGAVWLGGTSATLAADVKGAHMVTGADFASACGRFADLFTDRRLRHGNQEQLNRSVEAARWRAVGTAGERSIELRDNPHAGPLAAVVRALHGLLAAPVVPPPSPIGGKAEARRDGGYIDATGVGEFDPVRSEF